MAEGPAPSVDELQARLGQLLQNYCFGLWKSKLPQLYQQMFAQQLPLLALEKLDTWTHVCTVEKVSSGKADCLIYPPLPGSAPLAPPPRSSVSAVAPPSSPSVAAVGPPPFSQVQVRTEQSCPRPAVTAPPGGRSSSITACEKTAAAFNHRGRCQPPAAHQPAASPSGPDPSARTDDREALEKLRDLLVKYSHGLWAPALPRLFSDTYKVPLPEHLLDDLSLLMDFCRVDYPMAHDKTKAILYYCSRSEGAGGAADSLSLPSGVALMCPVTPPPLVGPPDQYPSVLVTETLGSNTLIIRFVGDNYSIAQENMEENMRRFFNEGPAHLLPSSPVIGQLVAIRAEQEGEMARAQVVELLGPDSVKVYYVDYGFSAVTSVTSLLELHQDFLSLPFQATKVHLAGLETFSSHPVLQTFLDEVATGKILLMETLETSEDLQFHSPPYVVLYDTSQEDDVNINAACLTTLQDQTMKNLLGINLTYGGVSVTSVSSEGVVYCQLPSTGASRLRKCLQDIEAIFRSQVTSDSLLCRPFAGQLCLARHQGFWSRVQIANTFGTRVVEILYLDLGFQATVEVTDLREIPPSVIEELAVIPPQATKCRLAELPVPNGDWTPEAFQMVKEVLLNADNCTIKVVKLEQHKDEHLAFVYLFIATDGDDLDKSANRQLARSHVWKQVSTPAVATVDSCVATGPTTQQLPPLLEPPPAGQNLDVFVPVACHPGHFVLQLWAELHKLMVLNGEMMLFYNRTWKVNRAPVVQKGELHAAKIDKNWRRVLVKAVLANGLVSVYELDYGRHELVPCSHLQLLVQEFRQLPFQAVAARLAGVGPRHWSEEASMLFRNHVEERALVAKVQSVQDCSEVQGETWERRWTVFLVDTTQEDRDLWVHSVMADVGGELSSAA